MAGASGRRSGSSTWPRPGRRGRSCAPRGHQINPSKTKQIQIIPSKNAWICLVLFVRIGTFQWVTGEKIRKSFPSPILAHNVSTRSPLVHLGARAARPRFPSVAQLSILYTTRLMILSSRKFDLGSEGVRFGGWRRLIQGLDEPRVSKAPPHPESGQAPRLEGCSRGRRMPARASRPLSRRARREAASRRLTAKRRLNRRRG